MLKPTSHTGISSFALSHQLAWLSAHSHSRLKQVLDKWRNITWNFLFTDLNVSCNLLFQLQESCSKILLEFYITFGQIAVITCACFCQRLLLISHLFMRHNASTVAVFWWSYLCMRMYTCSSCSSGDRVLCVHNIIIILDNSRHQFACAIVAGTGLLSFQEWSDVVLFLFKLRGCVLFSAQVWVACVWNSHVHKPTKGRKEST